MHHSFTQQLNPCMGYASYFSESIIHQHSAHSSFFQQHSSCLAFSTLSYLSFSVIFPTFNGPVHLVLFSKLYPLFYGVVHVLLG
jgi:hypothetical protein